MMDNPDSNSNSSTTPVKLSKRWYKRWWAILLWIFLGLIIISLILGLWVYYHYKDQIALLTNQSPVIRFAVATDDDPSIGPVEAPVTIVEFSDYQCSYSAQALGIVYQLKQIYGDKIRVIYRDFPVIGMSLGNLYSHQAGAAAECAQDQGKFWAFHNKLFQNQTRLTDDDLKRMAIEVGLNSSLFNTCLDSGRYELEVKQDLADGLAAGVEGTPTFFINGLRVAGVIPLEVFKELIEGELIANKSE